MWEPFQFEAAGARFIARGARLADGMDGELFVLHVDTDAGEDAEYQQTLQSHLQFAKDLGAKIARLKSNSVALDTAAYVTAHRITQVVLSDQRCTSSVSTCITFASSDA